MQVKVLYFAGMREMTDMNSEDFTFTSPDVTALDVRNALIQKYRENKPIQDLILTSMIAVD